MPDTITAHRQKELDKALAANALIERLRDVLTTYAAALIEEAGQVGTMKDSGLRSRSQAEFDALGLIEDIFLIDADDTREEIANECLAETGYDVRRGSFPAEDAAEFAQSIYNFARDGQLIAAHDARNDFGSQVSA